MALTHPKPERKFLDPSDDHVIDRMAGIFDMALFAYKYPNRALISVRTRDLGVMKSLIKMAGGHSSVLRGGDHVWYGSTKDRDFYTAVAAKMESRERAQRLLDAISIEPDHNTGEDASSQPVLSSQPTNERKSSIETYAAPTPIQLRMQELGYDPCKLVVEISQAMVDICDITKPDDVRDKLRTRLHRLRSELGILQAEEGA